MSLAYLMRMWFVKCVFSGMGVNIGIDRVAILFQCKEHTFMYFWVPKLLGIFFLFDLFWVPIPGLTIHPRACIVLHVSLIGGHRQIGACFPQPVWSSRSSWYIGIAFVKTLHFTTLVIFTLILESFTRLQSINSQSQIRVIQLPFVTNSTSGQQ